MYGESVTERFVKIATDISIADALGISLDKFGHFRQLIIKNSYLERKIEFLESENKKLKEKLEKHEPKAKKYRKKPVVIEAVRFTTETNLRKSFPNIEIWNGRSDSVIEVYIKTLEGKMKISEGDYIIKGIKGEYYPCKPDIFEETYERI